MSGRSRAQISDIENWQFESIHFSCPAGGGGLLQCVERRARLAVAFAGTSGECTREIIDQCARGFQSPPCGSAPRSQRAVLRRSHIGNRQVAQASHLGGVWLSAMSGCFSFIALAALSRKKALIVEPISHTWRNNLSYSSGRNFTVTRTVQADLRSVPVILLLRSFRRSFDSHAQTRRSAGNHVA